MSQPNPEIRTKRLLKNLLLTITFFLVVVIGTAVYSYYQYNNFLSPVGADFKELLVEVPKGASTSMVAQTLEGKGLIKNAFVFKLYFRINNLDGKIKPGEYLLNSNMPLPEIAKKVVSGSVKYYSFTIPEGYNTNQIADVLEEKQFINRSKFMELVAKGNFEYDFLQGLPASDKRLEGYLFPDTYNITKGTTEEAIIKMMLDRFVAEITPQYMEKIKASGLTLHQAVTLASIIEREAVKDEEREKVSAVFYNRLRTGIKLESCATVQYALGEQKTRLLYEDLEIESPYNTYKYQSLPPGPIASPGRASLQAAVNPADVDFLFFVVSEDGQHAFSRSLAEHNKAKAKYVERFKTP